MRTIRLLNVKSLELQEFVDDQTPPYVIASHRWVEDQATFKEVQKKKNKQKSGYRKIEGFASYVKEHVSEFQWLWIDTCCINKDSTVELTYSLNSMFKWYRNAELCLAYLADVDDRTTLQELLAPRVVVFVTKDWHLLGNKGSSFHKCSKTELRADLTKDIVDRTGLPEDVLSDWASSVNISVKDKMRWIEGRQTAVLEDMSYALFGILGITPGANYGEGGEGARQRLRAAIDQRDETTQKQADQFRKITKWLAAPDSWTNHDSARERHEARTGTWLLESDVYQAWKTGSGLTMSSRCLWVYGKAGCGKTILCYTAIKDLQAYYSDHPDVGHAVFYFSFSDQNKQSFGHLLTSLLTQLGGQEPALSMLREAYEKSHKSHDRLKEILKACAASYSKVFINLDGIDECPEVGEVRRRILHELEHLVIQASNVRILVTSRDVADIPQSFEQLGVGLISASAQTVTPDIKRYIPNQLSRSPKLSRLNAVTRTLVEDTLTQKADGMFRWVYCQLQELERSKSTRPKSIEAALLALPKDLDETYERMLNDIDAEDHPYALILLRWLAYAKSPRTLTELAEACIIDPTDDPAADGIVDVDNGGDWSDTLTMLAGLALRSALKPKTQMAKIQKTKVQAMSKCSTMVWTTLEKTSIFPLATKSAMGKLGFGSLISLSKNIWNQPVL